MKAPRLPRRNRKIIPSEATPPDLARALYEEYITNGGILMRFIFVDTSGIVAAMNSKDKHYQEAAGIFRALAREGCVLTISNYIRAETHALLVGRSGRDVASGNGFA